jgi:hypothetical protein
VSVDELWAAEAEWKTHVVERRSAERGMLACSKQLQRAREHTTCAVTAIGRREYDPAVEQLTESIRLFPRSDGLLRLRVRANLRARKLPDALYDSLGAQIWPWRAGKLSDLVRDQVAHLPAEPPAPALEQLALDTIKLRQKLPDDDGSDELFEPRVEC